jgi:hypothetical protein
VEQVEALAREMLETPGARDVMRTFHGELHHLARYQNVAKNGVPEFTVGVDELQEASARFFDGIFSRGEGLASVFTSTNGFVGPGLAPLYGISPAPSELEEHDLGPSRPGYFLQVPFLAMAAINEQPDPVYRGLTLFTDVLCASLPHPGDLDPSLPPPSQGLTNRERYTEATADCGDCHNVYINPLGFAFEGFDGIGQERTMDNGKPTDASGSYPFTEGTKDFADAVELMNILAESDQAHTCFAKKVTGYSLQRDIVEPDRPLLEALAGLSQMESIKETFIALVKDRAFRLRAEGTP